MTARTSVLLVVALLTISLASVFVGLVQMRSIHQLERQTTPSSEDIKPYPMAPLLPPRSVP